MESERDLIARSKKGDAEAFSRLVSRYEGRMFLLARKVCSGMPSEADDVYQETFLTAFRKLGRFRGESGLGTWLHRIASNLCWMRFRGRRRERALPLDPEAGPEPRDPSGGPEEVSGRKALREAVSAALEELPPDLRLAVVLRDLQGLSNEEAAKSLGASVAAVKSRVHRGRLLLRKRLGSP
jgi:RNA polymerase sigma-70 factor (ECF subfamily)